MNWAFPVLGRVVMWRTRNLGLKEIAIVTGSIIALVGGDERCHAFPGPEYQKLAGVTFYLALWPVMVAAMIAVPQCVRGARR